MRRAIIAAVVLLVGLPAPARAAVPAPGGRLVVLGSDYEVFVTAPDGSGVVALDPGPRAVPSAHHLAWSPDGTRVAAPGAYDGAHLRLTVDVFDLPGGTTDVVKVDTLVGGMSWSPDGRRLAYLRGGGAGSVVLETAAAGGCCRRALLTADDLVGSLRPAWSGDGRFLYVLRGDEAGASLWRVPVTGGPARSLATGFAVTEVAVAPDGRHLAMCGGAAGATGVVVSRPDGTARRPLADLACPGPDGTDRLAWSPDGRSLAVVAGGGLHRVDVRTGAVTPLTDGAAVWHTVSWSPDGAWAGFVGSVDGARGAWVVGADGTGLAMVPGTGGAYEAYFAPTP